jgi:CRP/FNR family transcriptional regulator, polysaccharide utilization system transcription regulator
MQYKKSAHCKACDTCNERSPLFSMLNKTELEVLNNERFEVVYNPGENIIKQGTSASHLISLTSGMGKIYLEGIDRKNIILDIILPWRIFGGPGLLTDLRYHYSVSSITGTSACFIPVENVKKVIRMNPDFAEAFVKNWSLIAEKNYYRLISLTQKQMPGRIADMLLYLSNNVYKSDTFTLQITRQEIGDFSNMTKESATRILKDLEVEGIIKIEGKTIVISKKDVLKNISLHG